MSSSSVDGNENDDSSVFSSSSNAANAAANALVLNAEDVATVNSMQMHKLNDRLLFANWSPKRQLSINAESLAFEWRAATDVVSAPLGSISLAQIQTVKRDRKRNADDKDGIAWYLQVVEKSRAVHVFSCDTEREMLLFIRSLSRLCAIDFIEDAPLPIASTDSDTEGLAVVHAGWLDKRGELNTAFRRRWFTLRRNGVLYYAVGSKSDTSKGSITLGDHDIEFPSVSREPNEFVVWTAQRKFVLRADSLAVANQWVSVLRAQRHNRSHQSAESIDDSESSEVSTTTSAPSLDVGEAPVNLANWSAFDVLDEMLVSDAEPRIAPIHPTADRSLMCANRLLHNLDSDEYRRRMTSGNTLALDAGRNNFVELPKVLSLPGAASLTFLDLGNCHIASLDTDVLRNLSSLVVLDLHNNQLRTLPDSVGSLTRLRELFLHNSATEYAGEWTADCGNRLVSLPLSLGNCHALEVLDVSQNETLLDLPLTMSHCRDMRALRLNSNRLAHVPACVQQMLSLEELLLKNNCLSRLDAVVFGLTALELLHLSHNSIAKIPEPVSSMTRLDELFFEANPIVMNASQFGNSLSRVLQHQREQLLLPAPRCRLGVYIGAHADAAATLFTSLAPFVRGAVRTRDNDELECDLSLPAPPIADLAATADVPDNASSVDVRVRHLSLDATLGIGVGEQVYSTGALVFFVVRLIGNAVQPDDCSAVEAEIGRVTERRRQAWRAPTTAKSMTQKFVSLSTVREVNDAVIAAMPSKTAPDATKAIRNDATARAVLGGIEDDEDLLDGVVVIGVRCDGQSHDDARLLRGAFPTLAELEAHAPSLAVSRFAVLKPDDVIARTSVAEMIAALAMALSMRSPTRAPPPFAVQRAHVELACYLEEFKDYANDNRFLPMLTHAEFQRLAEACTLSGLSNVRAAWRLCEAWGVILPLSHSLQRSSDVHAEVIGPQQQPAPPMSPAAARLASVASSVSATVTTVTTGVTTIARSLARRSLLSPMSGRQVAIWPTPRAIACLSPTRMLSVWRALGNFGDFDALRAMAKRDELTSLPQVMRLLLLPVATSAAEESAPHVAAESASAANEVILKDVAVETKADEGGED